MNKAVFVAAGILLSRLAGLVRLRVFAHYFGLQSDSADAFNAAFRIPNFLQNLFGEGALSASFIPVYAALVSRGERREADRVAGAVGALLALVVAILVLVGVFATPLLIALIAPGFTGDKRALTIALVRILFPGAGLLVLSAWCLGVLNSHGRFLLSYAAPVMWNAAMIATLVAFGAGTPLPRLAVLLAWGSVAGSALQFAVQLPAVVRVAPDARPALDLVSEQVREVVRNFAPVFVSRGVVQVSAYIDSLLASLLPTGAVTGLANAQLLYTLPVSLFGCRCGLELPAMAGERAAGSLRHRCGSPPAERGLGRSRSSRPVSDGVSGARRRDCRRAASDGTLPYEDVLYVWGILAGSVVGLSLLRSARRITLSRCGRRCYAMSRRPHNRAGYLFAIPLPGGSECRCSGVLWADGIGGYAVG